MQITLSLTTSEKSATSLHSAYWSTSLNNSKHSNRMKSSSSSAVARVRLSKARKAPSHIVFDSPQSAQRLCVSPTAHTEYSPVTNTEKYFKNSLRSSSRKAEPNSATSHQTIRSAEFKFRGPKTTTSATTVRCESDDDEPFTVKTLRMRSVRPIPKSSLTQTGASTKRSESKPGIEIAQDISRVNVLAKLRGIIEKQKTRESNESDISTRYTAANEYYTTECTSFPVEQTTPTVDNSINKTLKCSRSSSKKAACLTNGPPVKTVKLSDDLDFQLVDLKCELSDLNEDSEKSSFVSNSRLTTQQNPFTLE